MIQLFLSYKYHKERSNVNDLIQLAENAGEAIIFL